MTKVSKLKNESHGDSGSHISGVKGQSSDVGMTAQRLGSERSWADTFVPGNSTPSETVMTPTTTTAPSVVGEFDAIHSWNDGQDQHNDVVPDEPPPGYSVRDENPNPEIQSQVGSLPPAEISSESSPLDPEAQEHPSIHAQCPVSNRRPFVGICGGNRKSSLSKDAEVNGNGPRWHGHTKKTWRRSCRPITWLAVIAFWTIILTLHQFSSNYPSNNNAPSSMPSQIMKIPGRDIEQHETTNAIHGTFTLYDSVSLSTTTGSISVTIDLAPLDSKFQLDQPKGASVRNLRPATLNISSTTGSISVRYSQSSRGNAYGRVLYTTIASRTGSIHASDILHGNGGTTEIVTQTSSQHTTISVLGGGPDDAVSHLSTRSTVGSQFVAVRAVDGSSADQATLLAVRGDHRVTGTGSLHVTYPKTWQGKVEGVTKLGNLRMTGSDLQCSTQKQWNPLGKKSTCYRGDRLGDAAKMETTVYVGSDGTGTVAFDC